MQKIAMKSFNI